MPFITFLYIPSKSIGTEIIAETWYSFIFSAICLIPSQNAIAEPFEIGYKNPTVHSNVWWSGKNDKNTSFSSTFIVAAISIKLLTIFLCDNITAFDIAVVPDVNNIIPIFSLSILASKNSLFPSLISWFPFSTSSVSEYMSPSFSVKSIEIKYFICVLFSCFNLFIISSYLLE